MKSIFTLLIYLCLSFSITAPLLAQNEPEPSPENPLSATNTDSGEILESIEQINLHLAQIAELEKSLYSTEGEELESAIIQRREKSKELITDLKQFSKLARAFSDGGGDVNSILQGERDKLLKTGSILRQDIDQNIARLEKNRDGRNTLEAEGLKGYSSDNELIDVSFSLLAEYIEIIRSIDFKPNASIEYLRQKLPERAEFLASRIALSNERRTDFRKALKTDMEDGEAKTQLALTEEKLDYETGSLKQVIELAEQFGIEMSDYQTLLVKTTGEISSETLDSEVLRVLFDEWWLESKFAIQENSIGYLVKIIVFVLIIIGFKLLAGLIRRIIKRSFASNRVRASQLLQNMVVSITGKLVMLVGILVGLSQFGISLSPILAGLGVVGFIVGFALQDTLGNFAAGMMILFYRPYDVGDAVEVGGVLGIVRDMSIVNTTILTFDNQTLILPNSKIWGDVIKNITAQRQRRVDMTFGIGYDDDIAQAEAVLHDIVSRHELILANPEPVIKLHNLGDSSVDFVVRPWVLTENYWDVYWDITREVKVRFDAEGISIPYPQRDVHLYQQAPQLS
jgi:small conductance mechanosensitive channel